MLVQCMFDSAFVGDSEQKVAYCENCGNVVGKLSNEEIAHISAQAGVSLLCFTCEDISPPKYREVTELEVKRIKEKVGIDADSKVQPNQWAFWEDEENGLLAHWSMAHGWRIYAWDIVDHRWRLNAVKWKASQISYLIKRHNFKMVREL